MYKTSTVIGLILSVLLLVRCNGNHVKLKVRLVEIHNIPLFGFDTVDIFKGIKLSLDNNNELQAHYIDRRDSYLKVKNMISGKISNIYKMDEETDNDGIEYFNINNDTLIFVFKNEEISLVKDEWMQTFRLPVDSLESIKISELDFPVEYHNNRLHIMIGERNKRTFLGKHSEKIYTIEDGISKGIGYTCEIPVKYNEQEYYFRNSIRILGKQYIYYYLEMCDSLFIYDYKNLKKATEPVAIFNDLVRTKTKPYDPKSGSDLVYLKDYIKTTERNFPTFQKQDSNQVYIVKKLSQKDGEERKKYIIGKVRDNKYIGYALLPEDFNDYIHFIHNDDLYTISAKQGGWHHYKIEEL